jgi:transketolase
MPGRGPCWTEFAGGCAVDVILIATGSEVSPAGLLEQRGIGARVVSMPSWELFEEQPQSYKDSVLPPKVKARVSVEAAATLGWRQYAGDTGVTIGHDRFGASAPGGTVLKELGFTPEHVAYRAEACVSRLRAGGQSNNQIERSTFGTKSKCGKEAVR